MLYCGEEIADLNAHNMFANKDHNRGYGVDWSNALLPHGKGRFALIKKLAALRTGEAALAEGDFAWIPSDEDVLAYERQYKDEKITVYINFSEKRVSTEPKGDVLLSRGYKDGTLGKYGFAIFKK